MARSSTEPADNILLVAELHSFDTSSDLIAVVAMSVLGTVLRSSSADNAQMMMLLTASQTVPLDSKVKLTGLLTSAPSNRADALAPFQPSHYRLQICLARSDAAVVRLPTYGC